MLISVPEEFQKAVEVINKIEDSGFEAYFVGGSVRDYLLRKPIHDIDIATNAFPEEIKTIFPHTIDVGIEHGTVLALFNNEQYEITTFRTETTYKDYRRPDEVVFVRNLKEDLKRRDFTINALAMDARGAIIDLFDGQKDLDDAIIRAVGKPQERFSEDALRMMRAVRFASQLSFTIENDTLLAIEENSQLLTHVSVERIQIEFVKLMLGTSRNNGFDVFMSSKLFEYCPGFSERATELNELVNIREQKIIFEEVVWTLVVHALKLTDHELPIFFKKWKLSNHTIRVVSKLLKGVYQRKNHFWTELEIYQFSLEEVEMVENILFFLREGTKPIMSMQLHNDLPIHSLKDILISGDEILTITKKKPGPWLGNLLTEIETNILLGNLKNQPFYLRKYVEERLSEFETNSY